VAPGHPGEVGLWGNPAGAGDLRFKAPPPTSYGSWDYEQIPMRYFIMKHSEHCKRAKRSFGGEYKHVHKWLDELFSTYGAFHRKYRHHMEGVKKVRKVWGDTAAEVAKQHIVDDMMMCESPLANESWIAKDKDEYVKRGYL
jgi:hypothetical protein